MENEHFQKLATEAFEGYMRAMEVRKQKQIFNLITMDVDAVARSFGLKEKPDVDVRKSSVLIIKYRISANLCSQRIFRFSCTNFI